MTFLRLPLPERTCARVVAAALLVLAAACGDQQPTAAVQRPVEGRVPETALQAFDCTAAIASRTVTCAPVAPAGAGSRTVIGGQNVYLRLTSSNVAYNAGTQIFSFDVTVQNLLNEAIGTPDGVTPDSGGIQLFFHAGPSVTSGTGTASVENADSAADFTGIQQPYFRYDEILGKNEVSQARTWQLRVPPTAGTVSFKIYMETDVQYLLVINEVLVNPIGPVNTEGPAEYFEVFNAGTLPVNMKGLVIADSAASGRRPYHLVTDSLRVAPGAYVTFGGSTSASANLGATIDYAYGNAFSLANSLDALKVARVYGTDTLTLDRTQYSNASVSAKEGISRELRNPLLDNSNMDGSNWADAAVTATYTNGSVTTRGTPKAQNSTYTP